jgi:hypothetical protein
LDEDYYRLIKRERGWWVLYMYTRVVELDGKSQKDIKGTAQQPLSKRMAVDGQQVTKYIDRPLLHFFEL